ncbi:MAG: pentapeptide repeat-containing protein, partial [Actinobacteria bacterium]|nr:pentapeptide repeat-containing protein [Actinomycetota bacterium]
MSSLQARLEQGEVVDLEGAGAPLVKAEWIEALVTDNSVSARIHLANAIVKGNLDLRSVRFEREVCFEHCMFLGSVDLEYSEFRRHAHFDGSTFCCELNLHAARASSDLTFWTATFRGRVRMNDLRVDEVLDSSGTTFDATEAAEFERLRVGKNLIFKSAESGARTTRFRGKAIFIDAQIGSQLECQGARFGDTVDFSGVNVEDAALFRADDGGNPTVFRGKAHFRSVNFKAQAIFDRATFWGKANFPSARFNDTAGFRGVTFKSDLLFDQAQVASLATFEEPDPSRGRGRPAMFGGEVSMRGARFGGRARFKGTLFRQEADFQGAEFTGPAEFDRSIFDNGAGFGGASFRSSASFASGHFVGEAVFKAASFSHDAS